MARFGRSFPPRPSTGLPRATPAAVGALAGTADLAFAAGSSTLSGVGALLGAAALTFAAGSSTLTGAGNLAGTCSIGFTNSGTLRGAGALTSTTPLVLTGAGAVTGAGALAGSSALVLTVRDDARRWCPRGLDVAGPDREGDLEERVADAIAGSAPLVLSATGTITGPGRSLAPLP